MSDILLEIECQTSLPSAPAVIAQLTSLLHKDDVGSHEIANIAETDQAFTARILKLVNSPFYGFSRQITSVEESITMLGISTVNQLLLTTSVLDTLKVEHQHINLNKFWLHSFAVGVIAKHLLFRYDGELQNEAFLCGILHDIGRLIYVKIDPKKYIAFYDQGGSVTDLEKEKKWFGLNHQEVGSALGKKWNFPQSFIETIEKHHVPEKVVDHFLLVSAVHVADIICHAMDIGNSGNVFVTNFTPESWQALKLSAPELKKVIKKAIEEINKTKSFLDEL